MGELVKEKKKSQLKYDQIVLYIFKIQLKTYYL